MIEIKWASPFDISYIVSLLVVMHKEAETELSPINSEKTFAKVNEVIHRGICLIAKDGDKIVGTIGGLEIRDWWSDEKHVGDCWFYVSKDHRSSKAAIMLIKEYIKMSKELFPESKIRLAHVFSGDSDRKDKFFSKLGFNKVGSVFMEA